MFFSFLFDFCVSLHFFFSHCLSFILLSAHCLLLSFIFVFFFLFLHLVFAPYLSTSLSSPPPPFLSFLSILKVIPVFTFSFFFFSFLSSFFYLRLFFQTFVTSLKHLSIAFSLSVHSPFLLSFIIIFLFSSFSSFTSTSYLISHHFSSSFTLLSLRFNTPPPLSVSLLISCNVRNTSVPPVFLARNTSILQSATTPIFNSASLVQYLSVYLLYPSRCSVLNLALQSM